jgi:hypothetical protein
MQAALAREAEAKARAQEAKKSREDLIALRNANLNVNWPGWQLSQIARVFFVTILFSGFVFQDPGFQHEAQHSLYQESGQD